jgi:hypothetical protein
MRSLSSEEGQIAGRKFILFLTSDNIIYHSSPPSSLTLLFSTNRYPSFNIQFNKTIIDDEIVLARPRQMEMQRSSDGYWRTGPSIPHEAFSIRHPCCKLRRMASGRPYVCYGNMVPLYRNRTSINERHCILHRQMGTQRQQTSFSYTGRIYLLSMRVVKEVTEHDALSLGCLAQPPESVSCASKDLPRPEMLQSNIK